MEREPDPDRFDWDPAKAANNLEKHSISFADAAFVFDDWFRLDELERITDYGEERRNVTGLSLGRLLVVSYTVRGGKLRLISARRTRRDERER